MCFSATALCWCRCRRLISCRRWSQRAPELASRTECRTARCQSARSPAENGHTCRRFATKSIICIGLSHAILCEPLFIGYSCWVFARALRLVSAHVLRTNGLSAGCPHERTPLRRQPDGRSLGMIRILFILTFFFSLILLAGCGLLPTAGPATMDVMLGQRDSHSLPYALVRVTPRVTAILGKAKPQTRGIWR